MTRSAIAAVLGLGLLAGCSREEPVSAGPTSPVEAPPGAAPATVSYVCETGKIIAVVHPDSETAELAYDGRRYRLASVVSASGARYAGEGLEWRTVARGGLEIGTLSRTGAGAQAASAAVERCSRQVAPAAAPPPARACPGSDLRLAVEGGDAGMGHRRTVLSLSNEGAAACTLAGYPAVSLFNAAGRPVTTVRIVQAPGPDREQGRPPSAVELPPQRTAVFDLAWTVIPHEAEGETTCPQVATLRVTPPGSGVATGLPLAFAPCGGAVEVGPVRPMDGGAGSVARLAD